MGFGSVSNEIKGKRNAEAMGWNQSLISINEHGAQFRSYVDGMVYELTPEKSIDIQRKVCKSKISSWTIASRVMVMACAWFVVGGGPDRGAGRMHAVQCGQELHRGVHEAKPSLGSAKSGWCAPCPRCRRSLPIPRTHALAGGVPTDSHGAPGPLRHHPRRHLRGLARGERQLHVGRHHSLQPRAQGPTRSNDHAFFGTAIGGSLGATRKTMHDIVAFTRGHVRDDRPVHLLGIGMVLPLSLLRIRWSI